MLTLLLLLTLSSLSLPLLPFTFSPRYIIIAIIVVTLPSQNSYSTFHIQLHPHTGRRRYHPPHSIQLLLLRPDSEPLYARYTSCD